MAKHYILWVTTEDPKEPNKLPAYLGGKRAVLSQWAV